MVVHLFVLLDSNLNLLLDRIFKSLYICLVQGSLFIWAHDRAAMGLVMKCWGIVGMLITFISIYVFQRCDVLCRWQSCARSGLTVLYTCQTMRSSLRHDGGELSGSQEGHEYFSLTWASIKSSTMKDILADRAPPFSFASKQALDKLNRLFIFYSKMFLKDVFYAQQSCLFDDKYSEEAIL